MPGAAQTALKAVQWHRVTAGAKIAAALVRSVRDGSFNYYGNNFVSRCLCGAHVQLNVRWDPEHFHVAPRGPISFCTGTYKNLLVIYSLL